MYSYSRGRIADHRARSGSYRGRCRGVIAALLEHLTHLGKSQGTAKHLSGGFRRLSHHHPTDDLLHKLALVCKDLDDYSLETGEKFYRDATHAGFKL